MRGQVLCSRKGGGGGSGGGGRRAQGRAFIHAHKYMFAFTGIPYACKLTRTETHTNTHMYVFTHIQTHTRTGIHISFPMCSHYDSTHSCPFITLTPRDPLREWTRPVWGWVGIQEGMTTTRTAFEEVGSTAAGGDWGETEVGGSALRGKVGPARMGKGAPPVCTCCSSGRTNSTEHSTCPSRAGTPSGQKFPTLPAHNARISARRWWWWWSLLSSTVPTMSPTSSRLPACVGNEGNVLPPHSGACTRQSRTHTCRHRNHAVHCIPQTHTHTGTGANAVTDTHVDTDTEADAGTHRDRDNDRHRHTQNTQRHRDRDRDRDRHWDTGTDRETDKFIMVFQ